MGQPKLRIVWRREKSVRKIGSIGFSGYSARETASELGLTPSFFDNATAIARNIVAQENFSRRANLLLACKFKLQSASTVGSFNVVGMSAQLWDPETGKRRGLDVAAEEGGAH
ncbi:MAG: hypothetical protein ACLUKN_14995 [Bacilli bacterium]